MNLNIFKIYKMEIQGLQKFSDVLCTIVHEENTQFILKRVSALSAQLEILVIDRSSQTVKNNIQTMMFEGVTKDDLNYHMLLYYKPHHNNGNRVAQNEANTYSMDQHHNLGEVRDSQQENQSKEVNWLLLFYPNGIICIYENVLQQGQGSRKKVRLKEMMKADYENIMAPQILNDKIIFISRPNVQIIQPQNQQKMQNIIVQSPLLVSIEMEFFKSEILQKKQMSCREIQIVKINDLFQQNQQDQNFFEKLKITDLNCNIICSAQNSNLSWDIQCFISFDNGSILQYSFSNSFRKNKVFSVQKFSRTDIFIKAVSDADLDEQYPPFQQQQPSKGKQLKFMATCVDFLEQTFLYNQNGNKQAVNHKNLGLLLIGDAVGFLYILQMKSQEGIDDQLLLMTNISKQVQSEPHSIISCKWLTWLDKKFILMTKDGNLQIFNFLINQDDLSSLNSIQIKKIQQIQTFEELNLSFQFCDINQIGNQCIQVFKNALMKPGYLPDYISILWPNRVLLKHDLTNDSITNSQSDLKSNQIVHANKDKVITQMTLHLFQITSSVYPLLINEHLIGQKIQNFFKSSLSDQREPQSQSFFTKGYQSGNVIFSSSLSANGSCFLSQQQTEDLIPKKVDDQIQCPREYEYIFYIDEQEHMICTFSILNGSYQTLFSLNNFINTNKTVVYTDIQYRQNFELGFIKFLVAWIDPEAQSCEKKYLFTWILYKFREGAICKERSNLDGPKYGIYPQFLVGVPQLCDDGVKKQFQYNNINESIVCLDQESQNFSESSSFIDSSIIDTDRNSAIQKQVLGYKNQSVLKVFQFDPFLDLKDVHLNAKVSQIYTTPLRQGKVILYYNTSENILQFSKNKSESRHGEEDFDVYMNQNYCFKLAFDEKLNDVKFFGTQEQSNFIAVGSSNISQSSIGSKQSVKALILSNQRIYIVDKNLSIIQNFCLFQNQKRLTVKSFSIVANNTFLFSTSNHLYYLTQEKDSEQVRPYGLLLSFQKNDFRQTYQIVGAFADRIVLATKQFKHEKGSDLKKSQIKFQIRSVSLIEPLLLGYMASLSQSKLKSVIDVDLVQRACKFLDFNQISQNFINKLQQSSMLNTEMYLYNNTLQFDIKAKIEAFCRYKQVEGLQPTIFDNLSLINGPMSLFKNIDTQNAFFEILFPNRDINSKNVDIDSLEDRNDVIIKLQNDKNFAMEKEILKQNIAQYFQNDDFDDENEKKANLLFAIQICDILSNWQLGLKILKNLILEKPQQNYIQEFFKKLLECRKKGDDKHHEILQLLESIQKKQVMILEIQNKNYFTWFELLQDVIFKQQDQKHFDKLKNRNFNLEDTIIIDKKINQLKLGFGENSFVYFLFSTQLAQQNKKLNEKDFSKETPFHQLLIDNMGAFLGHENLIQQKAEIHIEGLIQNEIRQISNKKNSNNGQIQEKMQSILKKTIIYDESLDINSDAGAEEVNENEFILIYLRLEEGKGTVLKNLGKNECKIYFNAKQGSPWSTQTLKCKEPLDFEDNWGKSHQLQYSIYFNKIENSSLMISDSKEQLPQVFLNFTLEFWIRVVKSESSKENYIKIAFLQDQLQVFVYPQQIQVKIRSLNGFSKEYSSKVDLQKLFEFRNPNYQPSSWSHFSLVFSTKNGIKILINTQETFNVKQEISALYFIDKEESNFLRIQENVEVTEIRLWKCSLNSGIIKENHAVPLALYMDKWSNLQIGKSKEPKQKFKTATIAVSGLLKMKSKLDKIQNNVAQVQNQDFDFFQFNENELPKQNDEEDSQKKSLQKTQQNLEMNKQIENEINDADIFSDNEEIDKSDIQKIQVQAQQYNFNEVKKSLTDSQPVKQVEEEIIVKKIQNKNILNVNSKAKQYRDSLSKQIQRYQIQVNIGKLYHFLDLQIQKILQSFITLKKVNQIKFQNQIDKLMFITQTLKEDYQISSIPNNIGDSLRILHFIFIKIDFLKNLIEEKDQSSIKDLIKIEIDLGERKSRYINNIENDQFNKEYQKKYIEELLNFSQKDDEDPMSDDQNGTPPSIFNRSILSENEFKMMKENQEDQHSLQNFSDFMVSLKIAEMTTLFIKIIENIKVVFGDNQGSNLSFTQECGQILICNLINFALTQNLQVGQYATCELLLTYTYSNLIQWISHEREIFIQKIESINQKLNLIRINSKKLIDYGQLLWIHKYNQIQAIESQEGNQNIKMKLQQYRIRKCPQCQSLMHLGISQEKCFVCNENFILCFSLN